VPGSLAVIATVVVLAGAAGWPAPDAALAGHESKKCGLIAKGSHDYRVHAAYMSCKKARRGSTRYLRTGTPRPGFDCAPTENQSFYCQNPRKDPTKAYWAIRL
jgi:hypothetical protein